MKIEVVQKGIIKEEIKYPVLMMRDDAVVLFTNRSEGYAIKSETIKPFEFRVSWLSVENWEPFKGTITITCD